MLRVSGLSAGYDGGTVLEAVTVDVPASSVHAVVGHNGAGKTTLIKAICGQVAAASGRIELDGAHITRRSAHERARAGIGLVPQGSRVFADLTVDEHLALAFRGGRRSRHDSGTSWTPSDIRD